MKRISVMNALLFTYCLLLFVYVFYRAYSLSFTFDEVTTTQIASSPEWASFGDSANNHFLNILLIKFGLLFFDPSELVYRLPNVLGFILYLVYAVKLARILKPSRPYIPVVLLTAMPFILDFFSLSRGYGLALSFILPSIYFLLRYHETSKLQHGVATLLFGMLAVLSNFTSFNYFLPLLLVLGLRFLLSRKRVLINDIILGVLTGTFLLLVMPVAFELKNRGELYFGGRTSFYHDTILSLSRTFAYFEFNVAIADIVFAVLFFMALLFVGINIYKAVRHRCFNRGLILSLLFLLSMLSPVLQHVIFDTSFPTERTAVLFYPLLVLVLLNGVESFFVHIQGGVLWGLALLFLLHLVRVSNLQYCYSWRYDAGSKEVMGILKEEVDKQGEISVGIDYLYNPSMWYYQNFKGISLHEVVQCWEFDMGLEELDPKYYNSSITRKKELSFEDAERIVSTGHDYYYLHDFVVDELRRHGYEVKVKKTMNVAGASLVKLGNDQYRN